MAIIPGNPPGTPTPSPIPTPLVVLEKFYDRTKDLQYAIFLSLGGTDAEIEEKFLDRGDDLLYAILKKITGGGYTPPDSSESTRLLFGNATWNHGLVFDVTNCIYFIAGTMYQSAATQVELQPADPDNPRIDVICVNTSGNVVVVTGIAAPNPSKPGIGIDTQVEVTFVTVPAGSAIPAGIVNEDIYQEHEEWETAADYADLQIWESPNQPQAGAKCIALGSLFPNGSLVFTKDRLLSANDYGFMRFYIRVDAELTTKFGDILSIYFWNGTDIVSSPVKINQHGFNPEILGDWQLITIPMSRFAFTTSNFNKVTFKMTPGSHETGAFSLDNIVLQGTDGNSPGAGVPNLQQVTGAGHSTRIPVDLIDDVAETRVRVSGSAVTFNKESANSSVEVSYGNIGANKELVFKYPDKDSGEYILLTEDDKNEKFVDIIENVTIDESHVGKTLCIRNGGPFTLTFNALLPDGSKVKMVQMSSDLPSIFAGDFIGKNEATRLEGWWSCAEAVYCADIAKWIISGDISPV